ncbi:unnamed protein product [Durusdinium trenchii]|uniref:non-specific serine/threonine protein kinase n=2 Tax=Durusdinium trenchii TaxID=1381693 RepID=A0ABP0LWX5_9DINO
MNSLQGLSSWGSNLLGQASEQLGPAAAAAAASIRSGVKEVKKSVKENLGNVTATAASFSAETHQLQGVNGAPAREVTEVAFLAEGAFGAVMKVSCNRTGEKFALKKISCMEGVQVASSFEAAEREAKILSSLPAHDNIIRCFGYSIGAPKGSGDGTVKVLLELCHGHLLDFQDSKGGKLSPKEMMEPFVQIADAVRHLHAQKPPIQHRDLKVENILKGSDGHWKLCDFGSCSTSCFEAELPRPQLQRLQDEIDKTVTLLYRPPEMADVQLNSRKGYTITQQVDIWMLGCILYTLAFYRHPFQDNATPMAIFNAKYFIPADHPMARSAKLCALIHWLLAPDPKDRPPAPQVLQACREIGKSEYEDFVKAMPAPVREKILQQERIYGARNSKEPPKEWDLKNLPMATGARSQPEPVRKVEANGTAPHTSAAQFDVRFALAEGAGAYPAQPAKPKVAGLQEDLLSLDGGGPPSNRGLHHATSAPAVDLLDMSTTPSRAKSAPPMATGDNLLAFADFGSMPSQDVNAGAPNAGLFNDLVRDFADFGSAPSFDAFAPQPQAHQAASAPNSGSANLLDLM